MSLSLVRCLWLAAIAGFAAGGLSSHALAGSQGRVEAGLEVAVNWKWWVVPAGNPEWGMPDPLAEETSGVANSDSAPRPDTYEVKKGDALIKIANKFGMTVPQLKQFNELTGDLIIIGQVLRIPTKRELLMMAPPPPPPPDPKKKTDSTAAKSSIVLDLASEDASEIENVRLQVFLDREMFSPGAIDGVSGATLQKISEIYQRTHTEASSPEFLSAKAEAVLKQPYTTYVLRADDLKFIKLPKDEPPVTVVRGGRKGKAAAPPLPPPVTIDDLMAEGFLGYASAWEFVAERFHCDEAFLHYLNPQVKGTPTVGTEFQVPDVVPFEIENALDPPLQPAADPQNPVTASVVELSRLEITRNGKLIAVMPLSRARPGLRGRGSWTVLDAIPQPRLATRHEPRDAPKEKPESPGSDSPPANEQYLAPGPNNPVGIIWINLAKADSSDPLPYGLHGTSIPSQMGSRYGIGGFRLTNWDIARAVRLIPAGTELQWKEK